MKEKNYCNARIISVILIGQKYVTILENYSTFFFSEKRNMTNKITLADENKTVISGNQLIS